MPAPRERKRLLTEGRPTSGRRDRSGHLVISAGATPRSAPALPSLPSPWWGVAELILIFILLYAGFQGAILLWKLTSPADTEVPVLVGLDEQAALALLSRNDLKEEIVTRRYNENVDAGKVISCDPEAHRRVKQGRTIRLIVSRGSMFAKVPDVREMSMQRARDRLAEKFLEVGTAQWTYHDTIPNGFVASQQPAAGSKLQRGSQVNLVLSRGPQPREESASKPKPVGSTESPQSASGTNEQQREKTTEKSSREAETRMTEVSIKVPPGPSLQEVEITVSDDSGTNVVYRGFHSPGDVVSRDITATGRDATVHAYVNGVEVQRRTF